MTLQPSAAAPVRVVIADGPAEARRAVRVALEAVAGFEVAGEASDGIRAVEMAALEQADAVVAGLRLQPFSGLGALARIRAERPSTAVVVASDVTALAALRDSERRPHDLLDLLGRGAIPAARPPTVDVDLDASMRSVARAREIVREQCERAGCGELAATATLLASEIVTNAVVHAASTSRCSLNVSRDGLRVGVTDWGPGVVMLREIAPMAVGGRGLHIVDRLATSWGACAARGAKLVWFELDRAQGARNGRRKPRLA